MLQEYESELIELLGKCDGSASTDLTSQLLAEAKDILEQIKLEARTLPGGERAAAKSTIQKYEKQIQEAESLALYGHASGAAADTATDPVESQKDRAAAATERLQQSSQRVDRAKDLIEEIEATGGDIMGNLAENREKIESAHGKVKQVNEGLDKADSLATRMSKWWNRW